MFLQRMLTDSTTSSFAKIQVKCCRMFVSSDVQLLCEIQELLKDFEEVSGEQRRKKA